MTAAFVLVINMCIAGIFAVAFGVIAATNRMARGAAFMAAGYALGIVDVALEFLLPFQTDPTPVAVSIFVVFLLALSFCLIGISRHYRVPTPRGAMIAIWASALLLAPLAFSLPYGSPARGMIYQFSYCLMQGLAGVVILRSGRRQALDLLLMGMQFVAALLYLVKPVIGMLVGTATTPQAYMATTYAAVSQTMGAVTLVAVAMVLLLVMIRDATAEMTARSETDPLSSALNRRGFEQHGESALAGGARGVLVAADLDHFKQINERRHAARPAPPRRRRALQRQGGGTEPCARGAWRIAAAARDGRCLTPPYGAIGARRAVAIAPQSRHRAAALSSPGPSAQSR